MTPRSESRTEASTSWFWTCQRSGATPSREAASRRSSTGAVRVVRSASGSSRLIVRCRASESAFARSVALGLVAPGAAALAERTDPRQVAVVLEPGDRLRGGGGRGTPRRPRPAAWGSDSCIWPSRLSMSSSWLASRSKVAGSPSIRSCSTMPMIRRCSSRNRSSSRWTLPSNSRATSVVTSASEPRL